MPRRIIIFCGPCSTKLDRQIEVHEVTIWINEDRTLSLIANCECGNSQTVRTSTEELAASHFPTEASPEAPAYLM
jgi:hypothetical protein